MAKITSTTTVAFRVSTADERRLRELASASGKTPGELARETVIEKLDERDTLTRQSARLEQSLKDYREDFAKAIEALMILMVRKEPMQPEQIKQWVDTRLRRL